MATSLAQGAQLRIPSESAQPASLSAVALGAIIGTGVALARRSSRQTKTQRSATQFELKGTGVSDEEWQWGLEGKDILDETWTMEDIMIPDKDVCPKDDPEPRNVVPIYTQTLLDAAYKLQETVAATKDIKALKAGFEEELNDTNPNEGWFVEPDLDCEQIDPEPKDIPEYVIEMEEAEELIEGMKFESKSVPAMIRYMAKQAKLDLLEEVADSFMQYLYEDQSIASVIATTAQPLTEEEANGIKKMMASKLGVADIKLKNVVDENIRGGFILKYNFEDEDKMINPNATWDASYVEQLDKASKLVTV